MLFKLDIFENGDLCCSVLRKQFEMAFFENDDTDMYS